MSEKRNERRERRAQKKAELEQKMSRVPVVRRLFHNTGLKVISFVFAIILWGMVMSQTNPPRIKMVYDVPVELVGLETLNSRGLSLATEAEELPDTVDIRLEVPMDDLSRVSMENVSASLDLSRVMTTGQHELNVDLRTTYGTVTSSTVSSVPVEIENQLNAGILVYIILNGGSCAGIGAVIGGVVVKILIVDHRDALGLQNILDGFPDGHHVVVRISGAPGGGLGIGLVHSGVTLGGMSVDDQHRGFLSTEVPV